jgi:hypothetical protein
MSKNQIFTNEDYHIASTHGFLIPPDEEPLVTENNFRFFGIKDIDIKGNFVEATTTPVRAASLVQFFRDRDYQIVSKPTVLELT